MVTLRIPPLMYMSVKSVRRGLSLVLPWNQQLTHLLILWDTIYYYNRIVNEKGVKIALFKTLNNLLALNNHYWT